MRFRAFLLLFTLYLSLANPVYSHSGRTDAYGCHNCYTDYCYGEYHCHGGGSYVAPRAPLYILPAPVNPKNGNWTYKISSENWCNYDLDMTWDKPISGDRFSVAASKYAGGDPGNLVDTTLLSHIFKNLAPGKWYVNLKTGNSERWSNDIVYWAVDLPKSTPSLYGEIISSGDSQYLKYDISCLEKVEGVQEFIDFLNTNNNASSGEVLLSYTEPTTITLKGWDFDGKEYSQTLNFTPLVAGTQNVSDSSDSGSDYWWLLIPGGLIGWGIIGSIWNKIKEKNRNGNN